MKRVLLLVAAILLAAPMFAQSPVAKFSEIPTLTFPCQLESTVYNAPPITFNTPRDLSIYCSQKAEKDITSALTCFAVGTITECVGGLMYGCSVNDRPILALTGTCLVLTGAVLDVVAVGDVLGHFKWEYRRKQVDMYLTPAGATLKF